MQSTKLTTLILIFLTSTLATPVPQSRNGAVSFASVDISRQPGNGQSSLSAARSICPSSDSPTVLESKRRVAEDAEINLFNPAIASASNAAAKAAIQCQKDRNKVLKNHCQLVKAQLQRDQGQIDSNNKQLKKYRRRHVKVCQPQPPSRNNNNPTPPRNNAASNNIRGGGSVSFASVDISRQNGNGQAARSAAQRICPSSDSPAVLEEKRRVAEDAEKTKFNPAIAAASNADAKAAIQCQKDRNKVLKNHCQLVKAQLQNDQGRLMRIRSSW
ncbi:hypothetical protein BC829DRAFT_436390 [Chytridium lagenaria]|nr:hypothetical protein BC829DRAFT_436390 [Chytridium lagenaria]